MVTYFYYIYTKTQIQVSLFILCFYKKLLYIHVHNIESFFPNILGSAYWDLPTIVPVIQQLIKILNR